MRPITLDLSTWPGVSGPARRPGPGRLRRSCRVPSPPLGRQRQPELTAIHRAAHPRKTAPAPLSRIIISCQRQPGQCVSFSMRFMETPCFVEASPSGRSPWPVSHSTKLALASLLLLGPADGARACNSRVKRPSIVVVITTFGFVRARKTRLKLANCGTRWISSRS